MNGRRVVVPRMRFGRFELASETGELRKDGRRVRLQPQPMKVLALLASRAGSVVTREEIREALWPEGTFVDFEHGLNFCVHRVRTVLGDDAGTSRFIETVPRIGYRFVAEVERLDPPRLVVLPFVASGESVEDWFADGLHEELVVQLGRLPRERVRVIPRTSVLRAALESADPGKALAADLVLSGTVRRAGDAARIAVELKRAAEDTLVWTDAFGASVLDALAAQTEIAGRIAAALGTELAAAEPEPERTLTRSREAHEAYLRGRLHWGRRPEGLRRAVEWFERAIGADPGLAAAWAGLADAWASLGSWESGEVPPLEAMPRAREAAERALALRRGLADAHTSLAHVRLHFDWDLEGAERGFRDAIRLDPVYSHAHHWLSHALLGRGRVAESLEASRRCLELEPVDVVFNVHLAWHCWLAGEIEEGLEQCERTEDLDATTGWPSFFRGLLHLRAGRAEEAVEALRVAASRSGPGTFTLGALGHALAVSGREREAREVLARLGAPAAGTWVAAYDRALVHAGLGEDDPAMAWLAKAVEERSGWLAYLALEPRWDPFRGDPRFPVVGTELSP